MRELLLEIWTSVRRNKLRTFLTGFSVAWGIFMLVILLGSGNGLKNGVTSNFGNYATNSIDLYGGRTSKPYMGYQKGRRIRLWNSDLEILAREFPEVDEVAANSWFDNHTATYGNEYTKVWLRGSLPKIEQIEGVEIVKGRFVNDADIREYRKSLVIDQAMQSLLFKGADPLGARIKLDSTVFTVVGVYKGDAQRSSSSCYIPLTTGQLLYNANSPEVNNAIITIKGVHTTEAMKEFEKRVIRRLSAEHHFAPVGVSNIMLVTVTERTSEFGIRKALGAKPVSIIRLILTESVMITAVFGYLGMVFGVAMMEGVNYMLNQTPPTGGGHAPSIFLNPTLDLGVAVSATVVLVIAGLIAGYVPAYRAGQLKTIDALRYNK